MQPKVHLRDFSSELDYKASRSGGPGGQHVNKTNTKVMLLFDVLHSGMLSEEEREVVMGKLASKINQEGVLVLTAEGSRSQLANKEDVTKKFYMLMEKAFVVQKPRKPTKPTKAAVQRRLTSKKAQAMKKEHRKKGME